MGRGQEKDNRRARPGHRARRGQEEDKRRTRPGHRAQPQSPATEPSHRVDRVQGRGQKEDKRRTSEDKAQPRARPRGGEEEDKAQPQSPATEPSHGAQPQSSGARPVSVASSFLSKIEPQQYLGKCRFLTCTTWKSLSPSPVHPPDPVVHLLGPKINLSRSRACSLLVVLVEDMMMMQQVLHLSTTRNSHDFRERLPAKRNQAKREMFGARRSHLLSKSPSNLGSLQPGHFLATEHDPRKRLQHLEISNPIFDEE